jgi:sugar phosphate isomerase/epimerase
MGSQESWQACLQALPAACEIAQAIGATRYATWVPPTSDTRPYDENIRFHVERFQPIAEIMGDYGVRLGLEFIGPKTLRVGKAHEFIWNMGQMLDLCDEIGTGNVGLLLDAWHWYASYGTLDDLRKLTNDNVVYVHINDAPAGVPVDEQLDNVRDVSGATGVIDLAGFLQCLRDIGYDGPVTPEPFCARLSQMTPEDNIAYVGGMLTDVWAKALG